MCFGTLQTRLAACRKAVERLDRVERRLGRIVAPYAARAVVEGLRLHLAGQDQYAHWMAFLERRGIVLRRSAKSPCQVAARLMLQHAPAATVNMYAHAMGWALERVRKGHAEIAELADLAPLRYRELRLVGPDTEWIERLHHEGLGDRVGN